MTFKKIFGEHIDLVKSLLNAPFPLDEDKKIVDLEYISPEQVPVIPELKNSIVDVCCTDNIITESEPYN